MPDLNAKLDRLSADVSDVLAGKGVARADITVERYLNLRFRGTDVALMVPGGPDTDYTAAFLERYQREFGFVLMDRDIIVDDVRCARPLAAKRSKMHVRH